MSAEGKEDKQNLKEKDCPLSIDGWVQFLSSEIEINRHKYPDPSAINPILILIIAFIGWMIASVNNANLLSFFSSNWRFYYNVFVILIVTVVVVFVYKYYETDAKVKSLKTIIKNIIKGDLKESNDIRKEWETTHKEHENVAKQFVLDYLAPPIVVLLVLAVIGSISDLFLGGQGWFKYIFTGIGGGPAIVMYYAKKWKKFVSQK